MKKLIFIPLLFICAVSFGQTKEKWIQADSTQTAKLSINESEEVDSIINFDDISANITEVIYNDTLLFNDVNWIIGIDSSYATNKLWIWLYNLGKP